MLIATISWKDLPGRLLVRMQQTQLSKARFPARGSQRCVTVRNSIGSEHVSISRDDLGGCLLEPAVRNNVPYRIPSYARILAVPCASHARSPLSPQPAQLGSLNFAATLLLP